MCIDSLVRFCINMTHQAFLCRPQSNSVVFGTQKTERKKKTTTPFACIDLQVLLLIKMLPLIIKTWAAFTFYGNLEKRVLFFILFIAFC